EVPPEAAVDDEHACGNAHDDAAQHAEARRADRPADEGAAPGAHPEGACENRARLDGLEGRAGGGLHQPREDTRGGGPACDTSNRRDHAVSPEVRAPLTGYLCEP